MSRPKATGGVMRAKAYHAFSEAVEIAVRRGYARAHKHTDDPTEYQLCDAIETAVID
jgi:hypothetical protein